MAMRAIRGWVERNIHKVVTAQILAVIALWGLSVVVQPLQDWILRHSIFNVIIIILLNDLLLRTVDLGKREGPANVSVFQDEPYAYQNIRAYIEDNPPKTADLIEYSTATIHDMLENLKRSHCVLRILICNPDAAITPFQRHRINDRIRDLTTLTFRDYQSVEIRMYRLPAAIRGRLFDNEYLTVGWHTYTTDEAGIYGHTNPMINVHTTTPEGRVMKEMFTKAFEDLWSAGSTTVLVGPGAELKLDAIQDPQVTKEIAERLEIEDGSAIN